MKFNLKNTILMVIVLTVWVLVSYRFTKSIYPDTDGVLILEKQKMVSSKDRVEQKKTIAINEHLRDPFLGSYERKKVNKKKYQKSIEVHWPEIYYKGSMENSKTRQRLFFVQFQNQMQLWKKGKVYQEVKLIYGNKTHIVVQYHGATQKINLAP